MGTGVGAFATLLPILFVSFSAGVSTNCTPSLCQVRYELARELHSLRGFTSCDDVYGFDCICNTTIDIQFIEHPPYIYVDATSRKVAGLLPGILKQALSACCNNCTRIRYLKPYKTTTEAIIMFMSSTILLPFVTYSNARTAVGDIFIPTLRTKGVAYITSEEISMQHFNKFANSISSNWPLFCISLLLAVDAGIIVWILDCGRNRDEFPQDFVQGCLEGLWWAYVSMTTVGYGDKTPKTLAARAFGIVWITVGISLSGIFTASLITGMTQSLNDGPLNIEGKTVGILNATRYELIIAMREGAEVRGFATYKQLITEMQNGKLHGILMDILVLKYYWVDLEKDIVNIHYRMNAFTNSDTSFGILFSQSDDNVTNKAMGKFLENFFLENRDNMDVLFKMAEKDITRPLAKGLEIDNKEKSIFNAPEIYKLLFKYIGVATLVLFVIGFAYEKIKNWLKVYLTKRRERKCSQLGTKSDSSLRKGESKVALDHTTILLRARFVREMSELEKSGQTDAKIVKDRVLARVFHYRDMNGCHDNDVRLDDMQSNSEV